jgi:hypothetical protein
MLPMVLAILCYIGPSSAQLRAGFVACPVVSAIDANLTDAEVIVGLLGSKRALRSMERRLSWTEAFPYMLEGGREGIAFRPTEATQTRYLEFRRRAEQGEFRGIDVVLLRRSTDQDQ